MILYMKNPKDSTCTHKTVGINKQIWHISGYKINTRQSIHKSVVHIYTK